MVNSLVVITTWQAAWSRTGMTLVQQALAGLATNGLVKVLTGTLSTMGGNKTPGPGLIGLDRTGVMLNGLLDRTSKSQLLRAPIQKSWQHSKRKTWRRLWLTRLTALFFKHESRLRQ